MRRTVTLPGRIAFLNIGCPAVGGTGDQAGLRRGGAHSVLELSVSVDVRVREEEMELLTDLLAPGKKPVPVVRVDQRDSL